MFVQALHSRGIWLECSICQEHGKHHGFEYCIAKRHFKQLCRKLDAFGSARDCGEGANDASASGKSGVFQAEKCSLTMQTESSSSAGAIPALLPLPGVGGVMGALDSGPPPPRTTASTPCLSVHQGSSSMVCIHSAQKVPA